jgi:hypothetical protein
VLAGSRLFRETLCVLAGLLDGWGICLDRSSFARPYDLSDLEEHYLAAAVPVGFGTLGLSWHRFGLRGVTSEDLYSIAFGADYIRNSQDASLSFGGNIDIARVSYSSGYADAKTVVTGGLSVLLRPFPIIGIGYSIRNLGQPSFDWVPTDGATRLETTQAFGLSYYYQQWVVFAYERSMGQDGRWTDRLGVEVDAGKQLRIRGGLSGGDVTGGLGVTVSRIIVDAGVTGHDVMGLTYHISIGFSLAPETGEDYPDE